MPAGPPICRLRASADRTSGNGSGGWPTPNAGPQNDTDTKWQERRAKAKEKHGNNGFGLTLGMAAQTAGWPTPMAGTPAQKGYNAAGNTDSSRKTTALVAGWPTPNAIPESRGGLQTNPEKALERREQGHMLNLDDVAALAGWATPTTRDHKDGASDLTNTPINGPPWAAGELIPCADGKARRVEPGTFPLAHGIPNRVGHLRAYGNAIVPQLAAAFIRAYRDVREVE